MAAPSEKVPCLTELHPRVTLDEEQFLVVFVLHCNIPGVAFECASIDVSQYVLLNPMIFDPKQVYPLLSGAG